MPFQPVNTDHAIHEVAFVLTFSEPFGASRIEALHAAHGQFKDELPRVQIGRGASFDDSKDVVEETIKWEIIGVSFERFKTDGSPEWVVRADQSWLGANCLDYKRWDQTWEIAHRYLRDTSSVLLQQPVPMNGVALQYVDKFKWEGDHQRFDLRELLAGDSSLIVPNAFNAGAVWNMSHRWVDKVSTPVDGCVVNTISLSSTEDDGELIVNIDHTLHLVFDTPSKDLTAAFTSHHIKGDGFVECSMNMLHKLNKKMLSELLVEGVKERIKLNGSYGG